MNVTRRSRIAGVALLAGSAVLGAAAFVSGPAARPALAADSARPADDRSPRDVAADIDRAVAAAWEKEGLRPAAKCSDAEFVRRAYLDLVGTIPTALEVDDFLADASPRKREKLVDDLLASPGFSRHFANQWCDVLVGSGTGDTKRDFVPSLFVQWMEKQIASERPFAAWVTDVLTAEGSPYTNAAVNFTARKDFSPSDLAGSVSKAFLGVQIQCAQCHDHPYEDLTQKDFEGFSAFWGRLRLKPADIPLDLFGPRFAAQQQARLDKQVAEMVKTGIPEAEARIRAERQKLRTKEVGDLAGDARIPKAYMDGKLKALGEASKAQPKFLKASAYQDRPGETRRGALARWIVDPANPYTARTLANRTWGWFLGRGIVHPVDDFNSVNVPVVPEALDLLAKDAAAHAFDVKRLVRIVTATRAYQTSSAGKDRSAKAQAFFAAGPLKPMTPQQSFDSLAVALGVVHDGRTLALSDAGPSALEMEDGRGGMMRMAGDDYATPDRAKLQMAAAAKSFFTTFDDEEQGGEASFEGTVPQGLFLLNSKIVNGMLLNPGVSVVPRIVAQFPDEKSRVRQLFLRTLSREPTSAETARFVKFVQEYRGASGGTSSQARRGAPSEDRAAAAYADALWVLVSSSEFGSNH